MIVLPDDAETATREVVDAAIERVRKLEALVEELAEVLTEVDKWLHNEYVGLPLFGLIKDVLAKVKEKGPPLDQEKQP